MTVEAASPPVEVVSRGLWRIWFDRGVKAIDDGDFLMASQWLREALRHVCPGGADDRLHAMTQGQLAFAHLRSAFRTCHMSYDRCLTECEEKHLESLAKKALEQAKIEAECAFPRLTYDDRPDADLQTNLATARLFQVRGEVRRLAEDYSGASENFRYSRRGYLKIPSQVESLKEVEARLFETHFNLGQLKDAIEILDHLEGLVAQKSDKTSFLWLARLTAARATTLLELGQYRNAVELYSRWKSLVSQADQKSPDPYDFAMQLLVFARAHLIMGNYEQVAELIELADNFLCCAPVHFDLLRDCLTMRYCCCFTRDDTLRFDLVLLKAELAFALGDFACTREHIHCAVSMNPIWTDRKIRLALLRGRYFLALAYFREACECFVHAKQLIESMAVCRRPYFVAALRGLARSESETSSWIAAIAHASQAIRCLEENHETISAESAWSLLELAVAYVRDDRGAEAFPLCEKSRTLMEMLLRSGHPTQAALELTLAEVRIAQRQPWLAIQSCNSAGQLFRQFGSRDGFSYARALRIEAEAEQCQCRMKCAFQLLQCALKCWEQFEGHLGCVHSEKSLIWLDIAVADVSQGDKGAAEQVFYGSVRELLCQFKGNAGRAGFELNRRGNLFLLYDRFDEADWLYCHAEEYYRECYGPTHPFTVQVCKNREIVQHRRKDACPPRVPCCE